MAPQHARYVVRPYGASYVVFDRFLGLRVFGPCPEVHCSAKARELNLVVSARRAARG